MGDAVNSANTSGRDTTPPHQAPGRKWQPGEDRGDGRGSCETVGVVTRNSGARSQLPQWRQSGTTEVLIEFFQGGGKVGAPWATRLDPTLRLVGKTAWPGTGRARLALRKARGPWSGWAPQWCSIPSGMHAQRDPQQSGGQAQRTAAAQLGRGPAPPHVKDTSGRWDSLGRRNGPIG